MRGVERQATGRPRARVRSGLPGESARTPLARQSKSCRLANVPFPPAAQALNCTRAVELCYLKEECVGVDINFHVARQPAVARLRFKKTFLFG